ncbi:MAG: YgiT-type zinc finger protein [Leptospiraceae bacterium]|nr:YgiT-type zinc finger protein [Leptospiraceae bacterium]MCP5498772.1 YgiT-type zinc finger protein [Leptospiraceae bacterium]
MKLKGKSISKEYILLSYKRYEIIEEFPSDNFLPCFIVYSEYNQDKFHIIIAMDEEEDNVRILAAYYPNLETWEKNLKKRKKRVKCHICGGLMSGIHTDLPYKVDDKETIVVKQMPALQCNNCHQIILEEDTMQSLDGIIKQLEYKPQEKAEDAEGGEDSGEEA